MAEYHIGIGIIGNVYAGTTRRLKDGNVMWINKSDVTSEFYSTLLDLIQVNGKDNKMSFSDNKTVFTITLEKKQRRKQNESKQEQRN